MDTDSRFRITGIIGEHRVEVQEPEGWLAEAVLLADGGNILDTVLDFEPGKSYEDVRVVLSDQVAQIRGLTTEKAFTGRAMAVAFPEDESLWRFRRHLRFAYIDETGAFIMKSVRPGLTYLVATCPWPCSRGYEGENLKGLVRTARRLYIDRPATYTIDFRNR